MVPLSALIVAIIPRSMSGSALDTSRYDARPLDGVTSLQRRAALLQPRGQVSVASAVPSLLQRTRLSPSQRNGWFAGQAEVLSALPPSSALLIGLGRGNPH